MWITPITIWRETLVPLKFGEIDERPKSQQVFTIQIFTHQWLKSHINNEYQTNSLEDISQACTQQLAARIPSITFLRSMACGLSEFPIIHSQGKSPSAKGMSHIYCYSQQPRTIESIIKRASCHFTLTIKLLDIVAMRKIYTGHMQNLTARGA